MGFDSGSLSCRLFYVPRGLPGNVVERFADHAAPPLDTLGHGAIHGWVSSRHLLDRVITDDNAYVAGYLRLTLMKAERKVPAALLKAECRMEELALMQAEGLAFLKRDARGRIKKEVLERLLPKMPPTLTGIDIAYDSGNRLLYATSTSAAQVESLVAALQSTLGAAPVPVTAETAAVQRKRLAVRDLRPTSFTPELEDELAAASLGQDFLTWLWFYSERRGGTLDLDAGSFAVMIEGPLLFVMEGQGAHEAVLRKGSPLQSTEAKTSLTSGKKLRQARLTLARGDDQWTAGFDAETFALRGLKMPKGEQLDPISRFQERMILLDVFQQALLGYLDAFLDERADPARWRAVQKDIHRWVADRPSVM